MRVHVSWNPVALALHALLDAWARWRGYDVFVSYARGPASRCATRLHRELSSRYLVFLDRSGIDGGERFRSRIERELRRCRLLIVVLDENALESEWVRSEVEFHRQAHGAHALVLPLFVDPVKPTTLAGVFAELAEHHGYRHFCPARDFDCTGAFLELTSRPAATDPERADSRALADHSFRGRRRRQQALNAFASLLVSFAGLIGWLYWGLNRIASRESAVALAERTFAQHRVLDAEMQLAAAAHRYGATDELTARYREIRATRELTPLERRRLGDGWRVEAVSCRAGAPLLLLRRFADDAADERLALATFDGWIETLSGEVDLDPQVLWGDSEAFVFSGGTLSHVELEPRRTRRVETQLDGDKFRDAMPPVELRRCDERVVLLGRMQSPPELVHVDASSLELAGRFPIAGDVDADRLFVWTEEAALRVCVITREAGSSAVEVRFVDEYGAEVDPPVDFVLPLDSLGAVLPKLWKAVLSPDGRQLFVEVLSMRIGGVADRPSTSHWIAIDLHMPRAPLLLEPGIERLEALKTYEDPEALYSTEGGDLRGLRFRSLVVLTRIGETLHPRVERWCSLRSDPSRGRGLRAVFSQRGELCVLADEGVRLRASAVETFDDASGEALSLRLDDDERILVVEHDAPGGVVASAWRLGTPASVERIPTESALRAELSLPPVRDLAPER